MDNVEAIKKSEETYERLLKSSFELVGIFSENKILHINDATARTLGYDDPDDIIGHEIKDMISEDEMERLVKRATDEQSTNRLTESLELKLRKKDNSIVEVEAVTIKNGHHGAPTFLVYGKNITERNQYMRRLRALQRHVLKLVECYSLEDIAKSTIDIIQGTLGSMESKFCVVNDDQLDVLYSNKINRSVRSLPLSGKDVTIRAIKTRESQLVEDSTVDPDWFRDVFSPLEVYSELDVPVKIGGKVVAIINLEIAGKKRYSKEDKVLVEMVANYRSRSRHTMEWLS
jgi:PAS domain S-box-containing protein